MHLSWAPRPSPKDAIPPQPQPTTEGPQNVPWRRQSKIGGNPTVVGARSSTIPPRHAWDTPSGRRGGGGPANPKAQAPAPGAKTLPEGRVGPPPTLVHHQRPPANRGRDCPGSAGAPPTWGCPILDNRLHARSAPPVVDGAGGAPHPPKTSPRLSWCPFWNLVTQIFWIIYLQHIIYAC